MSWGTNTLSPITVQVDLKEFDEEVDVLCILYGQPIHSLLSKPAGPVKEKILWHLQY